MNVSPGPELGPKHFFALFLLGMFILGTIFLIMGIWLPSWQYAATGLLCIVLGGFGVAAFNEMLKNEEKKDGRTQ